MLPQYPGNCLGLLPKLQGILWLFTFSVTSPEIFKFGLLSWWDFAFKTGLCNFNSRKGFVYNLEVVQNYD